MSRRALLGALVLGGCGFRPVYGPDGGGRAPAAVSAASGAELASVRVGPMPERTGQQFRRLLQRSLEGRAPGTPSRYLLSVSLAQEVEPLGFRQDGTITRVRIVVNADWVLSTETDAPEVVERGRARTLDSFNIPDLQFYASEISAEATQGRLREELSERIVQGVAIALARRRPA